MTIRIPALPVSARASEAKENALLAAIDVRRPAIFGPIEQVKAATA